MTDYAKSLAASADSTRHNVTERAVEIARERSPMTDTKPVVTDEMVHAGARAAQLENRPKNDPLNRDQREAQDEETYGAYKALARASIKAALAHMPEDPRTKELAAQVVALREVLEWYGDEVMTYSLTQMNEPRSAAHGDRGARARKALTSTDTAAQATVQRIRAGAFEEAELYFETHQTLDGLRSNKEEK